MTFAPQGAIDHIFNCLNRDLLCVHVIIFDLPVTCCLHTATSCWHQSFQSGKKKKSTNRTKKNSPPPSLRQLRVFNASCMHTDVWTNNSSVWWTGCRKQQWAAVTNMYISSSRLKEASSGREHFSRPLYSRLYSPEFSRQQMANERRSATASALRWNLCKQRWKRGLGR